MFGDMHSVVVGVRPDIGEYLIPIMVGDAGKLVKPTESVAYMNGVSQWFFFGGPGK